MTRAAKKIIVVSNSLGGKTVDTTKADGQVPVWNEQLDKYIHVDLLQLDDISFEALLANNDIGQGTDQLAYGNHDHDVGDLQVLFENKIV